MLKHSAMNNSMNGYSLSFVLCYVLKVIHALFGSL